MKKKFEKPTIEIIEFVKDDIIITSGPFGNEAGDYDIIGEDDE